MGTMFKGLLFFPITPYQGDGEVDVTELAAHVRRGVDAAVAGLVPVFAGAGGPARTARRFADRAKDAGADGILLLPPYLSEASGRGLVRYVREATREDLPTIVYNRANARFDEDSALLVARLPQVIGFKDGAGDLDLMIRIVRAVRDKGNDPSFLFFNGMPTAEGTQRAYRAIGVPLYSSAAFAFAPPVALAYYDALERDDQDTLATLERAFYHPLARLRAKGTGYAVSLIKAGVELAGYPAGGVRPPLTNVPPAHRQELASIVAAGL